MGKKASEHLNLNSALIVVAIALIGWNLQKTTELGERVSSIEARINAQAIEIADLRNNQHRP